MQRELVNNRAGLGLELPMKRELVNEFQSTGPLHRSPIAKL